MTPFALRFPKVMRMDLALYALLVFAIFVRIAGIGYGLPLMVVSDEPPFSLAALKMMQLHTLLPAFHAEEFKPFLLYPPYMSYALLPPFALIAGIKYLLWQGEPALFSAHMLSDLSPFFMTARMVNVLLGVASVYLTYQIALAMLRSRRASLFAAFLVATSVLHVALSMVGRHWMPTSFVFVLVLYFLTRQEHTFFRRYLSAFLAAGIGMGFSTLSILAVPLTGLYYLLFDMSRPSDVVRDMRRMLPSVVLFAVLAVIPHFIYSGGNAFLGAVTLFQDKSLVGFLSSPVSALSLMVYSEPVLIALFLLGAVLLVWKERSVGLFITVWFLFYVAVFYIFFRFDPRFLLPLVPLFAIAGGYAFVQLWRSKTAAVLCIALLIPLTASLRLAQLALAGDTRDIARTWVLDTMKPEDRMIIFASGLRMPAQATAVSELRAIEQNAVRKVDEADETLDIRGIPYALNLSNVSAENALFLELPRYARAHGFNIAMIGWQFVNEATAQRAFSDLVKDADIVREFTGFGPDMSIAESSFTMPLTELFRNKTLGPTITIYRLH